MTTFSADGVFCRELALLSNSENMLRSLCFHLQNVDDLRLQNISVTSLGENEKTARIAAFSQQNVKFSRKQIIPLILEQVAKL